MLVNKASNFAVGEIVTLKLITGEEILAKVVESTETSITLNKPLTLVLAGGHSGQGMVAMAPFMLGITDDTNLTFDSSKILTKGKARPDAAAQYRQLTGSLQVASTLPGNLPKIGG